MMKKLMSLSAVLLLVAFNTFASKNCCVDLRGLSGAALVNPANAVSVLQLPYCTTEFCPQAVALQGANFVVNPSRGCGFTVEPICLTIRPLADFAAAALTPQVYNAFTEVVAQFRIVFDVPFKQVPAVTTALEILNPSSTGCPVIGGGSEVIDPSTGAILGYINDNFTFLTDITTTGFTLNFDAKIAAANNFVVTGIIAGLISLGLNFNFHVIAARTI